MLVGFDAAFRGLSIPEGSGREREVEDWSRSTTPRRLAAVGEVGAIEKALDGLEEAASGSG